VIWAGPDIKLRHGTGPALQDYSGKPLSQRPIRRCAGGWR